MKKSIDLNRRQFLTLVGTGGAAAAAFGATGCGDRGLATFLEMTEPELRVPNGPEKWITSVCGQCEGGCSIRVRLVGERAVNLTGNRLYPINRDGLCPKGLASLQGLYNPDRVRGPLQRVGDRGQNKWKQISWDEAVRLVAHRLGEIRGRGPQNLVFLSGQTRGLMDAFIARFCRAFGTPNDVRKIPPWLGAQSTVRYCMQGSYGPLAYDFEKTNYILSFGAPLLEDYVSPAGMLRTFAYLRQERAGAKAKVIQVEPRLSVTATRANEWVPINPGTEGALALGIAYVLIRENLYDKRFVEEHTFGFDDWQDAQGEQRIGFKTLVMQRFNADAVAQITGVPVDTILRIAHEFANTQPAIALGESTHTNAVYSLMAVHALNALVGTIDAPGGVIFPEPVPFKELPEPALDDAAHAGLNKPRLDAVSPMDLPLARDLVPQLVEALAEGKPYKAEALFLYYCNPVFSSPEPERARRALQIVPFIVSFSPYIDETTAYADVVLPDHTYLERWQDVIPAPLGPYTLVGLRQPAVKPLHDTMNTGDVLIRLAKAVGGSLGEAFPWPDLPAALRHVMTGIFEAKRGAIVDGAGTSWTGLLEERGWWYPTYKTFEEFWAQLQDKGGWWDPMYYFGSWSRVFEGPSGKFEFYSLILRKKLPSGDDVACLPHFEPPRFNGPKQKFPLNLNVFRLMAVNGARNADQPFLQEILGPNVNVNWDSWIEINPETAGRLGIANDDLVWVSSPAGELKCKARLYPGAIPGIISIPANLGHTAYGRWAKGIGTNPMNLVVLELDRLAGVTALQATRVNVRKARSD
jgi:anaerobic selenocysteine-containing dehydrogenase